MADSSKTFEDDPALYIYTSLTSGSSHIVTATSRMETILRANRIPFKAIDIATDDKARSLWGRRAGKDESGRQRKIPGLVQEGFVVGDLVEVEDWNEYGELKQHVTIYMDEFTTPSKSAAPPPNPFGAKPPANQKENVKPVAAAAKAVDEPKTPVGGQPTSFTLAMRQVGAEAAQIAKEGKKKVETLVGVGQAEPEPTKETAREPVKEETKPDSGSDDGSESDNDDDASKALENLKIDDSPSTPAKISTSHEIESTAALQSPNSTAWKQPIPEPHSIDSHASLQSPTSTAWKTIDPSPPVMTHRGSEVSAASKECIKKIEDEQAIAEESDEEESSEEEK